MNRAALDPSALSAVGMDLNPYPRICHDAEIGPFPTCLQRVIQVISNHKPGTVTFGWLQSQ